MTRSLTRIVPGTLVLSLLAQGLAAQAFEGVVTWQMGSKQETMTQAYKGNMVRTEMGRAGREGVMLIDGGARTMTMVMPNEKMYMVMSLDRPGMQGGQPDAHDAPPKITATGKTETIAGYTCEVYRYAEEAGKPETMEMCVAKGLGYFMMGAGGGGMMGRGRDPMAGVAGAASNPEYVKLYKDGFFPLRMTRIEGGKSELMMLATSIEKKSLDANAFKVPAGYQEMKMPAGMPGRP